MTPEMDPDLQAVAEFMQANLPVAKLVPIATAIGLLAPILWGRYAADEIVPLLLSADPPAA